MNDSPARPVFQNGQRLTAERLELAQTYLRDFIRRISLAPLSAGVAGGFEMSIEKAENPAGEAANETLVVQPGMAIDGKGRLLIVTEPVRMSVQSILEQLGWTDFASGNGARIAVQLDTHASSVPACGEVAPACIVESAKLVIERATIDTTLSASFNQIAHPNKVEPWQEIDDRASPSDADCSITLGHVYSPVPTGSVARVFAVTTFFRQGVAPRFGAIRDTAGNPAIYLNELGNHPQTGASLETPLPFMGVNVPAWLLKELWVSGAAWFANNVLFSGAATFAGLASFVQTATVCELEGNPVVESGVPLRLADSAPGEDVKVKIENASSDRLLGISAGPSVVFGGKTLVPIATGGVVKAKVPATTTVELGAELTAATNGRLKPATPDSWIVARAAQRIDPAPTTDTSLYVWPVHPARKS